MPRFAANLTLMYQEAPFPERFAAARADGFEAVECLFPYGYPPQLLAGHLKDQGLQQVLFNAPPGDWELGERGLAALPGRADDFRRGFLEQALPYAEALTCPRVHVMAGLPPPGLDPAALRACYLDNLAWAAAQARPHGVDVMIEPINTRDIPGYPLNRQAEAHEIVAALGAPNLKVQMDLYHCQIMEGDLATRLRQYIPGGRVGHLQIAGVPERHEPNVGEVNYPYLFELIDQLGYPGHIGCEYRPAAGTSQGLNWFRS